MQKQNPPPAQPQMSQGGLNTDAGGRPPVTLLYTPGDRPDRIRKALDGEADVVVVDLEDAVAPGTKDRARKLARDVLSDHADTAECTRPVQLRINPLDSQWGVDDLGMLGDLPATVEVRVPKVHTPTVVESVVARLGEQRRVVHCLLESALGVELAYEIAGHDAVASLGLGEADLRSELGPYAVDALAWCRARVVVAARAAGLPAPMQSVWTAVRDLPGLAESCRVGRAHGFIGRAAIHPDQLPVIRAAFRPEPNEVERARAIVDQVQSAHSSGAGTVVTRDGEFLDAAMVAGARQVLGLAKGTRP